MAFTALKPYAKSLDEITSYRIEIKETVGSFLLNHVTVDHNINIHPPKSNIDADLWKQVQETTAKCEEFSAKQPDWTTISTMLERQERMLSSPEYMLYKKLKLL